ncbi:cardiolipin synthase [Schnuerera sp. xch1]|uniref:cardiolipin synthase n=1 Tax=Schnuerera sp. xch1 TaxID=2874283 RepID=UPI001CC1BFA8|nr:cardiolipin synthase [Schnuerera sp. xch1]MBZ2175855.1 cardiolipin synthase [Schnuerera sp. xch1]
MDSIVDGYIWLLRNNFWMNMLFAILIVFFQRKNPTSTWLWFMVIIFLPGFGFLLYLFLGQDMSKKKIFQLKEEEDRFIRDRVLKQGQKIKEDSYEFLDPKVKEYENIINMHISTSEAYFSEGNKVEFYFSGKEKFDALLKSISNAKRYIYMEYYIVRSDEIGKKIMNKLTEKVKEGVEVKFLYDGMGGRKLARDYFTEFEKAGGEVSVFFPPFLPYISLRINYRNHRKICIFDGEEAYVGGFNIGNEYLGLSKKFGFWRDTHIKIRGNAVAGLQWRFFKDWKFAVNDETAHCNVVLPKMKNEGKAGIQIVSSGPDSKWASIKDGYFNMITNAKERVYIQTPYFIPDDSIYNALKVAGLAGKDIRVMIPSKPDHPFVYWAGLSYIGELLEAGVKFYTYENGFLHSKTFIMDDYVTSIGTANLDIRSFKLNFEVNAFIYDKEVNKKMVEQFDLDLKYCKEITPEVYANRSNIIKLKESFSRLLSPIL